MSETKWDVPTEDGHRIYGVKSSTSEAADSAIFMVHGLTSSIHDYNMKYSADFFAADYDVYRISLYGAEDGARQLVDCTIQTHAADLNAVLATFASGYRRVFLIGHSFGGTTIMLANAHRVAAASLWDPSFDLKNMRADFSQFYCPLGDYIALLWGVWHVIGKSMDDEMGRYDEAFCISLAQQSVHPVQVITAADGYYANKQLSYHSFGNPENVREFISGSEHCFYEGATCDELLAKTSAWFDRF